MILDYEFYNYAVLYQQNTPLYNGVKLTEVEALFPKIRVPSLITGALESIWLAGDANEGSQFGEVAGVYWVYPPPMWSIAIAAV